jgi:hypothetical protein
MARRCARMQVNFWNRTLAPRKTKQRPLSQWRDIRRLLEREVETPITMALTAMIAGMFFRPEEDGVASESVDNARVLELLEVDSLDEDQWL